jgi:hypothetical protein
VFRVIRTQYSQRLTSLGDQFHAIADLFAGRVDQALISLAVAERCAKARTSVATTAKP